MKSIYIFAHYFAAFLFLSFTPQAFTQEAPLVQEKIEPQKPPQLEDPNAYEPQLSLSVYPKLFAEGRQKISPFVQPEQWEKIETAGLGISLSGTANRKNVLHGGLFSLGLDFYPNKQVEIEREFNSYDVSVSGSNAYFLIGYRFWRFYAAGGIQYGFLSSGDTEQYEVNNSIGLRTMAGVDVFKWLKIESFYGFHRSIVTFKEDLRARDLPDEYDLSYGAYGVYVRIVLNEIFSFKD